MDALLSLVKFTLFLLLVLALVALAIPLLILNLVFKGFAAAFFRALGRFYVWCTGARRFGVRPGAQPNTATVSPPPYSRKKSEHVTLIKE